VYGKNKDYLREDTLMFEVLKKKYSFWLNALISSGKKFINVIEALLSNTAKGNEENKAINHQELIINIFKIYNFILKLRDDGIADHTEFRTKFAASYEEKLDRVVNCYNDILHSKPEEKLDTKDIMEPAKMKKLQTYIEELTLAGEVIDLIKAEIEKPRNMMSKIQVQS
jgi:hypothetical protein